MDLEITVEDNEEATGQELQHLVGKGERCGNQIERFCSLLPFKIFVSLYIFNPENKGNQSARASVDENPQSLAVYCLL